MGAPFDPWWCWTLLGYLSGSIPFALLIGKANAVDIRTVGSGNVGATNVKRALGRKWGVICLALDMAKGFGPVFAAGWVLGYLFDAELDTLSAWKWLSVGGAAVAGHVFPVWLKFKGGKGVATGFGVVLGCWPMLTIPAAGALITGLIIAFTTRYVSLASVSAAVGLPIFVVLVGLVRDSPFAQQSPYLIVTALMAVLVVVRHRTNLARWRAGSEAKVDQQAEPMESPRQ